MKADLHALNAWRALCIGLAVVGGGIVLRPSTAFAFGTTCANACVYDGTRADVNGSKPTHHPCTDGIWLDAPAREQWPWPDVLHDADAGYVTCAYECGENVSASSDFFTALTRMGTRQITTSTGKELIASLAM